MKTTWIRKSLAALAISILGTLGVLSVGTPASAAPPPGCISGYVCLFAGGNYSGFATYYNVHASQLQGCNSLVGHTLNNNIESVYGNYVGQGKWIGYYNSHNCSGSVLFSSTGGAYPTLGSSQRNVISSFKVLSV